MTGTGAMPASAPAIKVCGLTREADVRLCLDLGVDFTGFIFAPKSPRYIEPKAVARLPGGKAKRVGVFAGQTPDAVRQIMDEAGLDLAQLHGNEDADYCRAVGPERVIKVLWPERHFNGAASTEEALEGLRAECASFADACALFLLDAGLQGGGSGKTLPLHLLRSFTPPHPWLLAGGIGPDNARKACEQCSPYGLDCNSALEDGPGRKNAEKLRSLLRAVGRPGTEHPGG